MAKRKKVEPGINAGVILVDTQWVIPVCPYCGQTHYHGAGGIGADSKKFLGGRVPHCWDNLDHPNYILKPIPRKFLKRRFQNVHNLKTDA